ncbi:GNAT family N-acetyltransferase [Sediminibacter sp. Hel_I_10]|uniref:GNAT family N-acetyltransferase n=1 Tax=Sediminibacter sp. Hel_I_10 TaxID=1392490 RepID=UPI00047C6EFB|nr:GNAT family N-acetyltransferase [Sediminibacter sp. Hel_I_10]
MDIDYREATLEDLPEITAIFRDTIRTVNRKDYSEKQIEVWSSGADDLKKWQERIKKLYFIVAEVDSQIVGFSYLKNGNYIDGMFVHKDFQRRTVGSKLLRIMESRASINGHDVIKSDVSITALPFFDSHYYEVEKKQKKSFKGMGFENYIVYREL